MVDPPWCRDDVASRYLKAIREHAGTQSAAAHGMVEGTRERTLVADSGAPTLDRHTTLIATFGLLEFVLLWRSLVRPVAMSGPQLMQSLLDGLMLAAAHILTHPSVPVVGVDNARLRNSRLVRRATRKLPGPVA